MTYYELGQILEKIKDCHEEQGVVVSVDINGNPKLVEIRDIEITANHIVLHIETHRCSECGISKLLR